MSGFLITEEPLDVTCVIEESADVGLRKYKISGCFAQAETKNRNGRVYPQAILARECTKYNNNYIVKNRAMGELGHPDTPSINLDRVSHLITKLHQDGNMFMGEATIIDTPSGQIVKKLLDSGVQLGVSTRGVGSLKPENGYQSVGEDIHLATVDIVADPSAPEAFVQGIMEGREWTITNGGSWTEVDYDIAKRQLQEASRNDYEERKLAAFTKFMSNF